MLERRLDDIGAEIGQIFLDTMPAEERFRRFLACHERAGEVLADGLAINVAGHELGPEAIEEIAARLLAHFGQEMTAEYLACGMEASTCRAVDLAIRKGFLRRLLAQSMVGAGSA